MSITVKTAAPSTLLSTIKARLTGNPGILNWEMDADGDFRFVGTSSHGSAWLRPKVRNDELVFIVLTPDKTKMSSGTYAHYHTSWLYILLLHFDTDFSSATISALPADGDITDASELAKP